MNGTLQFMMDYWARELAATEARLKVEQFAECRALQRIMIGNYRDWIYRAECRLGLHEQKAAA